jgi:CBS domain-containing protein
MMNETVSSIMTTQVITVNINDKLSKVKEIVTQKRIHHVPVVDGKKLVGIITTGDLLWLDKRFEDYDNISVSDVMTRKIATLEPDDKIGSAAEVLLEHLFHCVPITKDGELLGIITSHDIMKYEFNKEYPNEKH